MNQWVTAITILAFFASCGQSLYRLSTDRPEKTNATNPDALFGFDPSCTKDDQDPWEPRVRLRKPGYPCLDTLRFRPALDVTQDSTALRHLGAPKPQVVRIANVKHNDRFWIADIPLHHGERLEFQLVWFKAPANFPAAHAQMVVHFDPEHPVRLHPQSGHWQGPQEGQASFENPVALETTSIALSVTGAGEEGQSCSLVAGQAGRFALTYGISTAYERYQEVLRSSNQTGIDSFDLKLPAHGAKGTPIQAMLSSYIQAASANFHSLRAVVAGDDLVQGPKTHDVKKNTLALAREKLYEQATYRTLSRNCATSLMELMDTVTEQPRSKDMLQRLAQAGLRALTFYPPGAAFVLHSAHLLQLGERRHLDLPLAIKDHAAQTIAPR